MFHNLRRLNASSYRPKNIIMTKKMKRIITILIIVIIFPTLIQSKVTRMANASMANKSVNDNVTENEARNKSNEEFDVMDQIATGYVTDDSQWEPIMEAIIEVESGGDPKAVSGIYSGAMQIAPILVKQCNIILEKRGLRKRYTLNDRFSVKKSKEMFIIIQSYFNPEKNVEKAIRAWQGGFRYNRKATQRYYKKVMYAMANL